ncbi:MAG: hypothetical protein WDO70_03075 [Alphaproteobacteria bacterium]
MARIIIGLAVLVVIGGGAWLAFSDIAPPQETVRQTLPDESLPH